jgi:tetratricopeptide (TPR) repeat protein
MAQAKYAEAAAILRDVVSRNASYADAWSMLAKALDRMGRPDEALDAYKRAVEAAPMLAPGTAMSMAELYMRLGRLDDAIHHAEIAVKTHPGAARMVIAQAYLGKKDLAAAERETQLLMADPDKKNDAAVMLAQIRIAQRRLPEAFAILDDVKGRTEKAGESLPPNLWFARGDALARSNRVSEAEAAFAEEIRHFPRNREAYVRLAVLELLSGREGDARKTFDLMLRLNPEASTRQLILETYRALGRRPS